MAGVKKLTKRLKTLIYLLGALVVPAVAPAQNVTNYNAIPEPFLFLLREPAVHDELELTDDQRARLRQLNERFDGDLLSTRNKRPEDGQRVVNNVMTASRQRVSSLLTPEQYNRLRQIRFRLRGISFVLDPDAAQTLAITDQQRERIEQIVQDRQQELTSLQQKVNNGESTESKARLAANRALRREQTEIQDLLTDEQRQKLPALIGRRFDASQLGRVSFKAPELAKSGEWLNSNALQLAQLRGKVVALHFYAFQ